MRRTAILAVHMVSSRAKMALGRTGETPAGRHNATGSHFRIAG